MFGFLNVNKPRGITSHDVVARLRKVLKIKQIGHTGTLDPMAEGVLPVAIGKASRLIEYLKEDKAYRVTLVFGKVSDTFDMEGNVEDYSARKVEESDILSSLNEFRGEIEQIPPAYSAVHYNGKRLYELARQGIVPDDIPKRKICVAKNELVSFDFESQVAVLDIECSKGTYIRSIVSDLGQLLGVGAVMTALTRTKSGMFNLSTSIDLDTLVDSSIVEQRILNPVELLSFEKYILCYDEYKKVMQGQKLSKNIFENEQLISLIFDDKLVAIAQQLDGLIVVKKVFGL